MIDRPFYLGLVHKHFAIFPVVAILGPRQCGKTTLARLFSADSDCITFDLEHPTDRARLAAPMVELERLSGLVVIDEIQRMPELFEILRVLVDRPGNTARFLILGSASMHLVKGVSESLAGRIGFVDLSGFDVSETGLETVRDLWRRGGFPRSFLAESESASWQWREDFIRTFLERDINQLGLRIPADALRRFWAMVAHYHGQIWNAAEFARSLGSAEGTARRYLDVLSGAYMVRVLQPWHENLKKRQVKAPKIYVRDSGLLHALLSLTSEQGLMGHTKLGASWEGFVLELLLTKLGSRDVYYWATHAGAELDLLAFLNGKRYGFEVKFSDAPRLAKSMQIATEDLQLERLYVIYPGSKRYILGVRQEAIGIQSVLEVCQELNSVI